MSEPSKQTAADPFFGEVIHRYTRQQALEDGVLKDAGPTATEAGFRWPVALTAAAWADCVEWSEQDSEDQIHQDLSGRLWDVVWMAATAIRLQGGSGEQMHFELYRIPRDGTSMEAQRTKLKLVVGPGDEGEPVVTVMLPLED